MGRIAAVMLLTFSAAAIPPASLDPVDYKKDVAPLLRAACYSCHGAEKQKAGLRLDAKGPALKGGESGAAIVPRKSAESLLIKLVAGEDTDRMMPAKGDALTAAQIGVLRRWIDDGAPFTADADTIAVKDKADHWAFKPAARPHLPRVAGARHPIDAFILARLAKEGIAPNPPADRRTLIRRLSFDLTGLPPAPEDVDAFVADTTESAYEKLVDRLLASPRYGERWARHWLDIVHFGETHGYDKDKLRPNAWPYRDYVVRAFNADKPYGRFIEEQLAGDVLYPNDPDGVIATGFIAAGPWDFVGHTELREGTADKLLTRSNDRDDMVMTAMSTFASLTVHCARCHDHKFDPIEQEDYYRLQAVFAGVDRGERDMLETGLRARSRRDLTAARDDLAAKIKTLQARIEAVKTPELAQIDARLAKLSAQRSPSNGWHSAIEQNADVTKWVQLDLGEVRAIDQVRLIPARPTDFPDTPGFGFPPRYSVEFATDERFSDVTCTFDFTTKDYGNPGDRALGFQLDGTRARYVRVTATRLWKRTNDYVFALAEAQVMSGGANVAGGATITSLDSIEAGRWSRKALVDGFDSRSAVLDPTQLKERDQLITQRAEFVDRALGEPAISRLKNMIDQLTRVEEQLSQLGSAAKVFAAVPLKSPRTIHFLHRGDVKQPRQAMLAGALAIFNAATFDLKDTNDEGARRAALAKWLSPSSNHLVRRSIVNRVWHYHFGRGIVDTPNDFGHMGAMPSHPELLDFLAFWFEENGQSLKKLHRLIVTSDAYRRSSANNDAAARLDAENHLLWRGNRQRLDAESIRDAMLAVSGKLDLTMGGPSVRQFFFKDDHSPVYDYARHDVNDPANFRRSIYRHIVRSVPDPFMETLDCPDPSMLAAKRNTTLTALQALSMLNNPFVTRQAEHLAERASAMSESTEGRIEAMCRSALSRAPSEIERRALVDYAAKHGLANAARVVFNLAEFMFVD